MPNVKISDAADAGTLLASDMLPLARSGNTNAYHATMAEVAAFASTSLASGAYGNVGRNLLHNPLFNVAQRGAGPWSASGYTLDRWAAYSNGDANSLSQVAASDTIRTTIGDEAAVYLLQNTFTGTTGGYNYVSQQIEGVRRLGGKTVTLSFWASCAAGTLKLGLNMAQGFGTGGSPSAGAWVNATGLSVTLSTTWTRYSVSFAIPSTAGKTLGTNGDDSTNLTFWYSSGAATAAIAGNIGVQSGTVQLWGVQLEVGSVATPLEKPGPRYDYANCQRFFQFSSFSYGGYGGAGVGTYSPYPLAVKMRAIPTVVVVPTTQTNCGSSASINPRSEAVSPYTIVTVNGGYIFAGTFTASADL